MAETVLRLGVGEPSDERVLVRAIADFTNWRVEQSPLGSSANEVPDLMVRTVFEDDGRPAKALTFQKAHWAETFLRFWRSHTDDLI
ncbi:MAG: hypothetical protein AAGF20_06660 [Pseudomonadota bacterium]